MADETITTYLTSLSSRDIRRIATIIFYDTPLSDFNDSTDESVLEDCLKNIIPASEDQDGKERIWTREGKSGDDLTLEELIEWFEREKEEERKRGEWTHPLWITHPEEYYS